MANYTKIAIMRSFEEALAETPFDKLTVSSLAKRCGISANTFYYHYHDIYELLDEWLGTKQEQVFSDAEQGENWKAGLKSLLHLLQDNPKLVGHVFDSISRERLERYIFNSVEKTFYALVRARAGDLPVPDDVLKGISQYCCYSMLGFVLKFIWGRMAGDVDSLVERLGGIFDGTIEYVINKAKGENLGQNDENV